MRSLGMIIRLMAFMGPDESPMYLNEPEAAREMIGPSTLAEYAGALSGNSQRNLPGTAGTFWVRYESIAMMRIPVFCLDSPGPGEIRRILWYGPAALASYQLSPDELHPANAELYVCADPAYSLEKLSPAVRRNIRRGFQELRIKPLDAQKLMAHGAQTFRDTLRRNGLGDSTPEEFRKRIALGARCPGRVFLGAWSGDQLAGYLSILEVDDWVEIRNSFSTNALLRFRPNDVLVFSALSYYLRKKGRRLVTFGLSSIQADSNRNGLHLFKTKLGFEAQPVHRVFVLHPFLQPFANRLTLNCLNTALRFRARERRLRKARGVLACILGHER